ncbi:hypothetical protein DL98DRAFT_520180 [Cadophora sp. DSE1049]|nr:hypothetical protein DL98DRAFT_520180 [Cadophora sp. DSE1049]
MPENHSSAAQASLRSRLLFSSFFTSLAAFNNNISAPRPVFSRCQLHVGESLTSSASPAAESSTRTPCGHQPCLIPATNLASNSPANQPQAECHALNHTRQTSPRSFQSFDRRTASSRLFGPWHTGFKLPGTEMQQSGWLQRAGTQGKFICGCCSQDTAKGLSAYTCDGSPR